MNYGLLSLYTSMAPGGAVSAGGVWSSFQTNVAGTFDFTAPLTGWFLVCGIGGGAGGSLTFGGGGGEFRAGWVNLIKGQIISVTVGAGGAVNNPGGVTSFGTYISCNPGLSTAGSGRGGSAGFGGQVNFPGGNGGVGQQSGGGASGSPYGRGGNGGNSDQSGNSQGGGGGGWGGGDAANAVAPIASAGGAIYRPSTNNVALSVLTLSTFTLSSELPVIFWLPNIVGSGLGGTANPSNGAAASGIGCGGGGGRGNGAIGGAAVFGGGGGGAQNTGGSCPNGGGGGASSGNNHGVGAPGYWCIMYQLPIRTR